ncbi:MAG: single-stranded DNA-binding protein [marine benthic group bacterium]|nr:single-stranded DNA-binding protein [Gemmatimonadota bacterium]
MSRSLNRVQIIGNLGADPELRTTTGGARVATLSVATSRRWTDRQGQPQEKTEWHRVIFWEKLAELAERYLKKGDRVYVEGSIEYRQYEDREGQTRYITEIRGREIIMLGGRSEGADFGSPTAGSRDTEHGKSQGAKDDYEEFSNESLTPAGDDDLPF